MALCRIMSWPFSGRPLPPTEWPAHGTGDVELAQEFPNARAELYWAAEQREIVLASQKKRAG